MGFLEVAYDFCRQKLFPFQVVGNIQIYVKELVKAKEPDLELLLLMSIKAALQKVNLCATQQPVPPANGIIY